MATHARYIARSMAVTPGGPALTDELRAGMKGIPGGIFEMGARRSTFPADLDSPRRKVKVSPFLMAPTTVTNSDFARFVEATGYSTVAEEEGWSYVFHLLLGDNLANWPESPPGLPWWRKVDGARWSAPEGPGSDVTSRPDHPVVHVTWYDAVAYARWGGLRLPREAEWEFAARGGLKNKKFPWGNDMMPGGRYAMNTFQGEFPKVNTGDDGWIGTASADAFEPNGYGLYTMTGNVWEWVQDFFGALPEAGVMPATDPVGPAGGYARVQRGGSYLCHVSYCDRYHVHSRTQNDPDSSAGNGGFRVAADA
ncbi:formylglycine-generating enzyme family protein [Oricola sp.]|uniref:formylglycine-generating enzyme family protein n=1 Tax=Oricola sp. TaxID=1979950 RepID=UPI002600AE6D|nr:formylglycine-generating enzyme family protein [Oricola sp.]MCI5078140.1 formylglycine-generating enzyme family protein [Oricola sp.]